MRTLLAVLALLLAAAPAGAFTMPEGSYELTGFNGAGAEEPSYKGYVFISRTGETYALTWKIGERQTQRGVAILSGDVLSVGYFDESGRDAGVVSYRLVKNGVLDGLWAPLGSKGCGRERLVWRSAAQVLKGGGGKS